MARKRNQGSKWIQPAKRQAIYNRDGRRCVYCGAYEDHDQTAQLTLDHLHPCELGGGNEAKNLVTCCLRCNSSKGKLNLQDFLARLQDKGVDIIALRNKIRNTTRRKLAGYNGI